MKLKQSHRDSIRMSAKHPPGSGFARPIQRSRYAQASPEGSHNCFLREGETPRCRVLQLDREAYLGPNN